MADWKPTLVLLILLATTNASYVERPWNDEAWVKDNPNVADLFGNRIYDPFVFQRSIDGLGLDGLKDRNGFYSKAYEEKKAADLKYGRCRDALLSLNISAAEFIYKALTVYGLVSEIPDALECFSYGTPWKSVMDNAMDGLETDLGMARDSYADAQAASREIGYTGICDDDFIAYSEKCIAIGYKMGVAGEYEYLQKDVALLNSGLAGRNADTDMFRKTQDEAENAATSYSALVLEMKDAIARGNADYAVIRLENTAGISGLRGDETRMHAQGYPLIIEGAYPLGSSVSAEFSEFASENSAMGEEAGKIEARHPQSTPGWLKGRLIDASALSDRVWAQERKMGDLDEVAVRMAEYRKKDAEQAVAVFEAGAQEKELGGTASAYYIMAKDAMAKGDAEQRMGYRYDHYSNSVKYANMAGLALAKDDAGLEMEKSSETAKMEDFLKKAEKDGIDVSLEAEMLKTLKRSLGMDFVSYCREMRGSVVDKAMLKYALDEKRARLYSIFDTAGEEFSDLRDETASYETGYIKAGNIEYETAMGHLSELDAKYDKMLALAKKDSARIAAASLKAEMDTQADQAELFGKSVVRGLAVVRNPSEFDALDAKISFEGEIGFSESDLVKQDARLRGLVYSDGKYTLYLKNLSAHDVMVLEFIRNVSVVDIRSSDVIGTGLPDFGADLIEKYGIYPAFEIWAVHVGNGYSDAELDGLDIPVSAGYIKGGFTKGKHELVLRRSVHDAYSISRTEPQYLQFGTKKNAYYEIRFNPAMDLDCIQYVGYEKQGAMIENLQVFSLSGESIRNKKTLNDGTLYFEVCGIKGGREADVKVSYTISDPAGYLLEQISALGNSTLDAKAAAELAKAEEENDAGDIGSALAHVENAKRIQEGALKAGASLKAKNDAKYAGASEELALLRGIGIAGCNGSIGAVLTERMDLLSNVMAGYSAAHDEGARGSALSGYDSAWLGAFMKTNTKTLMDRYAKAKKAYLETGGSTVGDPGFELAGSLAYRLEAAPDDLGTLCHFDGAVSIIERKTSGSDGFDSAQAELDSLRDSFESIRGRYEQMASSAKGSAFAYLFDTDASALGKNIDSTQSRITRKTDLAGTRSGLAGVVSGVRSMNASILVTRNEAEKNIAFIEDYLVGGKVSDQEKAMLGSALARMKGYYADGKYVDCLKEGKTALAGANISKTDDTVLLVATVTALFVAGGLVFYIYKTSSKQKPKELKKLKRLEERGKPEDEEEGILEKE
ncbi:MAG: hypothetical protein ACP5NX_02800 [Candidatus Bilamarchaeaceae archaeon]